MGEGVIQRDATWSTIKVRQLRYCPFEHDVSLLRLLFVTVATGRTTVEIHATISSAEHTWINTTVSQNRVHVCCNAVPLHKKAVDRLEALPYRYHALS